MPAPQLLSEATRLHQSGRLGEAERLYREAVGADPSNDALHYRLAFVLYQQARESEALQALDTALKLKPDAGDALTLQGVLLLNAGRFGDALSSISRAAAAQPRNAQVWHTRGVTLTRLGRFPEALTSFDKALAIHPTMTTAHCHRGAALTELRRYAEAVAAFDTALALAPDLYDAWSNRGLALFEMERFADSLESYDKAADLRPELASVWINRGKTLDRLMHFDAALESYDRALAVTPGNSEALYARALTLRTMERLEEALECVDRGLATGQTVALSFLRGWLLAELNRIPEGLDVIRQTALQEPHLLMRGDVSESEHKSRHDVEQRAFLTKRGLVLGRGDSYIASGEKISPPAVNPQNAPRAEADWRSSWPRVAVIDNLLSDEALAELRRFCLESTVWRTSHEGGYLGATPEQGFACPLLAQIAEELRVTFPAIIGDHRLRMLWGFKYGSRLKGIGLHADQAAVNVNFWITPDEANRDPATGGMVIWDKAAPRAWDVRTYNGNEPAVRSFLESAQAKAMIVPYRCNRAVVFDSDLFHETDSIDFKEEYVSRRINITMLYGRRTPHGA